MSSNGRAFAESFVLHGLLAGLVIMLAGLITPPPKTIRLEFSLLEKVVTPVQQESPAPKAPAIPKPEPAPKPQPKIVAHTLPKKVKQVKPKLAAVKPTPAPEPMATPTVTPEEPPQPDAVSIPEQNFTQKESANAQQMIASSQQGMNSARVTSKLHNYLSLVRIRIESQKRYPLWARSHRLEGEVSIRFVLNPDGQVSRVGVSKSSGQDCLDEAAIEAIRKASPMPPPPDGLLSSATSVEFTIVFKLT